MSSDLHWSLLLYWLIHSFSLLMSLWRVRDTVLLVLRTDPCKLAYAYYSTSKLPQRYADSGSPVCPGPELQRA